MHGNLTWSLIHEHSGNGDNVLWFQARLNEARKRATADTPSERHGTVRCGIVSFWVPDQIYSIFPKEVYMDYGN